MKSRRDILRVHYAGLLKKVASWAGLFALLSTTLVSFPANAAQITARKVTLSSSAPTVATATTKYTFNFTVPTTGTAIKSWEAQACTAALGTCTMPTGFASTASTVVTQPTNLGAAAGWTVNTATVGSLRMVNAANATNPTGAQTVVIDTVQNPTSVGPFYLRITTHSNATWSAAIDTGTVAAATATQFVVSADVAESLTFCVGATWVTDCTDITGATRTLAPNPLTTASISTGVSEMGAATNGTGGFVITYLAGQFTCTAPCSHNFTNGFTSGGAASAIGTEEFGLKVALTSGTGGAVTSPYGGTNYAWNPTVTTQVADSGAAPAGLNRFTVTYGANVSPTTNYGSYSTTFNYVCTPTF